MSFYEALYAAVAEKGSMIKTRLIGHIVYLIA